MLMPIKASTIARTELFVASSPTSPPTVVASPLASLSCGNACMSIRLTRSFRPKAASPSVPVSAERSRIRISSLRLSPADGFDL